MSRNFLSYLVLVSYVLTTAISYEARSAEGFSLQVTAKGFATFFNESKNIGKMFETLAPFLSKEEIANAESILKKYGLSLKSKLPKCQAENSKLVCGQYEYQFKSDGSLEVRGQVFQAGEPGKFDQSLAQVFERVGAKKVSGTWELIPSAHAFVDLATLAIIGGTMVGAVAVIGLFLYMGKSSWEKYKDGTVTCNGKFFVLRKSVTRYLLPTNESEIIDPETASSILLRRIDSCTEESAKQLQDLLRPDRRGSPPAKPGSGSP